MKILGFAIGFLTTLSITVSATVRYVDVNSTGPTPQYTSWATAATNIQDAVDVADPGDLILVTNGVYQTGGRVVSEVHGAMANRVAVTKAVSIQSINGPSATFIRGESPGMTNGESAVRCVYLTNGAALVGFTLTNGATRSSGFIEFACSGGGVWCASTNAVVSNCVLTCNSAIQGGGAYKGTLNNCTLTSNSAGAGGGASSSTLNNCTVSYNSGSSGGGTDSGELNNCTLSENRASSHGGGAAGGRLNGCSISRNSAPAGGGVYFGTLKNCTLSGNAASTDGGGAYEATLDNCVVYYNTAPSGPNYFFEYVGSFGGVNYCCTTPLPAGGLGNLINEPELASPSHLSAGSPCRGAGSAAYASGLDIDGEARANPPSIGCDEYNSGAVAGPLNLAIQTTSTNVAAGFELSFTAQITGRVSDSRWDFGDGTVVSNRPFASHSWTTSGDYSVVLWAYNETYSNGVSTSLKVHVVQQPVHYVASASSNPVSPYASWATAARNIQDAVDASQVTGALVLVTNGIFSTGGRVVYGAMTNRVAVTKRVIVRSVNGAAVTMIQGYKVPGTAVGNAAIRCVYLTDGATLAGFTLTNGATRRLGDPNREQSGGAVFCESISAVVSNCVLTGNTAAFNGGGACFGSLNNTTFSGNSTVGSGSVGSSDAPGGGAYCAVLNNCILSANTAASGGGAYSGTLSNCTLTGNSALDYHGGGVDYSTLYNCVLSNNSASSGGGGASYSTMNNCVLTGNSASSGGGAAYSMLYRSVLTGNAAWRNGGGAFQSTLNGCLLTINSAAYGGGDYECTRYSCTIAGNSASAIGGGSYSGSMNNSIVYYNTAPLGSDHSGVGQNYCCTVPGYITNAPLFVNQAGGNLRLQSNSPCINRGNNSYVTDSNDLDGGRRIVGGVVDIGAYELIPPDIALFNQWLQQYGLPTDGSADYTDNDADVHNNWQEWRADTNPTNSQSVLLLASPSNDSSGILVQWQSTNARTYFLERANNLGNQPPFTNVASNIVGQAGTTTYTDSSATNGGPFFYRVGVQE